MIKKVAIFSLCAAYSLAMSDSGKTYLDTTVITATGFESPLRDETRNVTVITADDIENKGYDSIQEILEKAPSVSFSDQGFGQSIDLRGQGEKANTSVKVLLNGVSMNLLDTAHSIVPINSISVDDIDRVEIIPGGGSVLYGGGTAGGVINIITKQKPQKFFANLSAKVGSYQNKSMNLGVGGSVSENLFLKLNVNGFDELGYRREDKKRGFYVSGATIAQITDAQSLTLNANYYNDKVNTSNAISEQAMQQDRRQPGNQLSEVKNSRLNISLDYGIKATDSLEFHLMPHYMKNKNEIDGGLFYDKKIGLNTKARFDWKSGNVVAGYDFLYNKGIRESTQARGPVTTQINLDLKKQTHSIYALAKQNLTNWLSLSAGARYELAKYDNNRENKIIMVGRSLPSTSLVNQRNIGNYAFEISPSIQYRDTGNVYFKFEHGFVSPSPTQMTNRLPNGQYEGNDINSEQFNTYEVGVRDLIFGQFVSATAFITDKTDEIAINTGGSHFGGGGFYWNYYNIGKTRRMGVELYAEQNILDVLKLTQTFSYINAEIRSGDQAGQRVPLVPKVKFVFGLDYSPIKPLNLTLDIKHFSDMLDGNGDKMKDKTTVDIGAKYTIFRHLTISAGVKNLFNNKYDLYQGGRTIKEYIPAPERNFYAEIKYKF